jgi:O-antigen ligase
MFGAASLSSCFLYSIFAGFTSFLIFNKLFFSKIHSTRVPIPFLFILGLVSYIILHGVILEGLTLTHFYLSISFVFNLSVFFYLQQMDDSYHPQGSQNEYFMKILMIGFCILSFIESSIVILQYLSFLKSYNEFFNCSGTWDNPNVIALFLSFSLIPTFKLLNEATHFFSKSLLITLLLLVVIAIGLLKCRSAYIITIIFLLFNYWDKVVKIIPVFLTISKRSLVLIFISFTFLVIFLFAFQFKEKSTNGRIGIWKNTMELILDKPIYGVGVGMFEKSYNLYIAKKGVQNAHHINMPYNDFLELMVEGGIISLLLWICFITTSFFYCIKRGCSVLPIIGLIIMQLTNFGFQAIPAFTVCCLFITLYSLSCNYCRKSTSFSIQIRGGTRKIIVVCFMFATLILCVKQIGLANAFYTKTKITNNYKPTEAIEEYKNLRQDLNSSFGFHENFGDAYQKVKNYTLAKNEYLLAFEKSSRPSIISKLALCYLKINNYDSSIYYCTLAQNMEPYKLAPKIALLKVFQIQKDTQKIILKSTEIIKMPIKIENEKSKEFKRYAEITLAKYIKYN